MAEQQPDHAFFEQMQRDNEKLRELLGQVTHIFAGGLKDADRVAESLVSLASQLETHFEEEEVAGVFDDVVERAPRLSERVDQLKQQHNELRTALAAINQTAGSGDGTAQWWNDLSEAFHEFSTNLMHHEHSENELVQEAYTQDIGSKD
jgi:iron-sulfur cluster repair protein YtfE (RIC family)